MSIYRFLTDQAYQTIPPNDQLASKQPSCASPFHGCLQGWKDPALWPVESQAPIIFRFLPGSESKAVETLFRVDVLGEKQEKSREKQRGKEQQKIREAGLKQKSKEN